MEVECAHFNGISVLERVPENPLESKPKSGVLMHMFYGENSHGGKGMRNEESQMEREGH